MIPDSAPVAAAPSKGTSDQVLTYDLTTAGGVARYVASLLDPALYKCVHRVEQLSGGFTNYVWRVKLAPVSTPTSSRSHRPRRPSTRTGPTITIPSLATSLVLKYFAPQIRALPGVELSQDRAAKEYSALAAMSAALSRGTLSTGASVLNESQLVWSVPTPFHFCAAHHAVIMEDAATPSSVLMFDFLRSPHTRSELFKLAIALVDFARAVPVALTSCHGNGVEWNQGMNELFETSTEPQMLAMVAKCSAFGDQVATRWAERITAARKHPHARDGQIFGDFWPNSILLHLSTPDTATDGAGGAPTAMSVIDWECSRLGHPDQDFVQMVGNLVTMRAGTRQTAGTFDLDAVETMIAELLTAARPYLDGTWDHPAMSLRYVAYLSQFDHFGITDAPRAIAESAEFLEALFRGVSWPSFSNLAAASE
ncbi:hypothetical protein AMAG_04967 [Allomyces macrogynus ATCC 38327]|uniref:Uncharacterized protein n=1 Tax=Allomyces macrogynus (strain ATCC 38327) TaxID=578462 RepID=A0A0L0S6L6_ALLM3|nr:hypothetical protein AMAG_04967 [Allomyces macrogynus ATCC 38327]|eukprot:KNE58152.1 hypothetical protein AMAG_04967 [Allomyces macrogynus ATCC 38327]